jgi:hypothetical protein
MKKNLFMRLSAMTLVALVMAACSSTPQQEEYTNAIPGNAGILVGFNCQSLGTKSGIKADDPLMQRLTDMMKDGIDAATVKDLEVILNDPAKSGIDVEATMYFYMESETSMGLVAKVKDAQALQSLLQTLSKEGACSAPEKADGFSFSTIRRDALLAFNSSTLLICNVKDAEQGKQLAAAQLKQTAEQGISNNEGFKKLRAMNGDMEFMFRYGPFFNTIFNTSGLSAQELAAMPNVKLLTETLKDAQVLATLSFEAGKIYSKAEYVYNSNDPKFNEYIEMSKTAAIKLNNKFLKNFPQTSPLVFTVGINGAKLYDAMKNGIASMPPQAVPFIEMEATKEIMGMLKGDLTLGVIDIPMGLPTFLLLAEVTDAAPLNKILTGIPGVKKEKGDEYSFNYMGMFTFYFGVRDKVLYFTDDSRLCADLDKAADAPMDKSKYAAIFKGNNMVAAVLNVEQLLASPLIKMVAQQGGQEAAVIMAFCNMLSYAETSTGAAAGEGTLYFKDANTNALQQIVNWSKSLAGM